ncbi:MAG: transposase, partial [Candidatus Zixiibacteriota bacterium]
MSYRELNFDNQNLTVALSEVKQMFGMHFGQGCRYMTKRFYEKALAVDFDSFINASRHERTSRRRGYRNGDRSRSLLTTVGALDIRVPRDREGKYRPALWDRYQRVDRSLEEAIKAMFLGVVSTRKVGDILEVLCGARLSASKVTTVVQEL